MNGHAFTQWPTSGKNESWLRYSYYDLSRKQNPFMKAAYLCYGHSDTDQVLSTMLPLTEVLEQSGDLDGDGVITNMEFFQALDPNLPDR